MSKDVLVVKNLNKDFESSGESFEVFKSLNFEIYPKTSTALLGESGSGKTTLIHLIAGLESPDTGLIKINNFEDVFCKSLSPQLFNQMNIKSPPFSTHLFLKS